MVTAPWSLPGRPAITALRELDRRWRGTVLTAIAEPTQDAVSRLGISSVPTWIRFVAVEADHSGYTADGRSSPDPSVPPSPAGIVLSDLDLRTPAGGSVPADDGRWRETGRYVGALAKGEIEERFGPSSR